MNTGHYSGRLAKAPVFRDTGKTPVCYLTLIRNEYAGKDEAGDSKERAVAVEFTAFAAKAKALHEHAKVGDQLIVEYSIQNYERQLDTGETKYGFSFIVNEFEFGAPGREKREQLAGSAKP